MPDFPRGEWKKGQPEPDVTKLTARPLQSGSSCGVGTIFNLTPDQEKKLVECYAKKRKDYSKFTNNCGDPHKDCLQEATGVLFSDSFFPVNIGNDSLDSPYYKGSTFYSGPSRPFWKDALWAR